jgi:NADH:ubiquinone oxidoreductase subunit 4 (subunit M)
MYWQPAAMGSKIEVSALSRTAMTALMVAIIWLGIYPRPILKALEQPNRPVVAASQR